MSQEPDRSRTTRRQGALLLQSDPRLAELAWRDPAVHRQRTENVDPTTGLHNRGAFLRIVGQSILRDATAVIVVDLDEFWRMNLALGQRGGDRLIQEVALAMGRRIRATDPLARIGSDIFCVALQGLVLDHLKAVGARLLDAVAAVPVPPAVGVEDAPPALRATAGVATSRPTDTAATLLDRALAARTAARRSAEAMLFAA